MEAIPDRRFGDPVAMPTKMPSFIGMIAIGLIVDGVVGTIVSRGLPSSLWKNWHMMFIGLSTGQIALACAIRLRYESRRWLAYATIIVVAVMGAFFMSYQHYNSPLYRPVFTYLWGESLLVLFCAVPSVLFQKRFPANAFMRQFSTLHLMALCVFVGFMTIFLNHVGEFLRLGTIVFITALPAITGCWILAVTESRTGFLYMLFALNLLPGLIAFSVGAANPENIVYYVSQIGTIVTGGLYLLSFPREPSCIQMNK